MTGKNERPFRRHVFYIPGFDPHPARRYRELYRSEGRAQAMIAGYGLEQGPFPGGWRTSMNDRGVRSETSFTVLQWSDLVRSSMRLGLVGTHAALFRTAWIYLRSGALMRVARLRKGPLVAALMPVVLLLGGLISTLVAGFGVGLMFGWGVGLAVGAAVAFASRALDRRLYASYLMQDYAYSAQEWGAYPVELDARLAEFAEVIRSVRDVDEILIVGHSSGAYLAVSVLADILRSRAPKGPALSLLTLGQVVPMVSLLPGAVKLRQDLGRLSQSEDITWVDVSAPGDGCCFALTNPVAVSGVHVDTPRWPLVLSAAFSETLSPNRQAALKHKYFKLHFQYLCAFDDPSRFDYFATTSGSLTLGARFGERRPSPSRIDGVAA